MNKQELKKQVGILITASENYLVQIKEWVTELKKIYRKEADRWTKENIIDIENIFNALKDILVFGDLENEIPALSESLENYEKK